MKSQHKNLICTCTTIVSDLPVCENERDIPQCCSVRYILERLNVSEGNFLAGLRMELEDRFEDFDDLVDRLRDC